MFVRNLCLVVGCAIVLTSCVGLRRENGGQVQSYPAPNIEAPWIRNGEPLVWEDEQWFPVDDVESFMDTEVYQIGEFKGVQIFVDKVDTKPYERIYTKFARNKFRYFVKKDD